MKQSTNEKNDHFLLALHSCSNILGIAVADSREPENTFRSATFEVGKDLSKQLLNCIEQLLPKSSWTQICRLAVATGPGGFTGTRLTVVFCRTLAHQIKCNLDGISSFQLMASRLAKSHYKNNLYEPFWIIQHLSNERRVAGKYQLKDNSDINDVIELKPPSLLTSDAKLIRSIDAHNNVEEDVKKLLKISISENHKGTKSSWQNILPIYPTSPVHN